MKPGIPWSVKGIEPEVREAAKHAAKQAGVTLGEWLNTVILDQNDPSEGEADGENQAATQDYFAREPERREIPHRREMNSIRLEDIAQQLSKLAQRERESAAIMPYEPPRPYSEERDTFNRIASRIDSNERQAVEAFTAVNERLSVLGRMISMAPKPQVLAKPEDVPGYPALDAAIRNVVEHIEVSEKRTRDSLKSMQDRLGEMAERATNPSNPEELLRAAPAFTSLESRFAEMSNRMQRSESLLQAGLPDQVRKELDQLNHRIEGVRAAAETMAGQAQTVASGAVREELRTIEARTLGVLKEAQAAFGGQQSAATDLLRLKGEIGSLNKRIDEVKSATATERDVHALRVAVEQLSTRVAQGPDMRPIADMDRRIGELTRKLDQNIAAARALPQFGEMERRIAELDRRLGDAMRQQGNPQAVKALEQHIAAVNERVGRTEKQLGHLETMERSIHQLYESLEQNRALASQTAEEAANRAVERILAVQTGGGPSPELRAMEEGLRAVRDSAANADQRNQETLEAVHETLEQIVNKLSELETASAGHQLAANMAHHATEQAKVRAKPEPVAQSQFFDPMGKFEQQIFDAPQIASKPAPQHGLPPEPEDHASAAPPDAQSLQPRMPESAPAPADAPAAELEAGAASGLSDGDDFIAAARRAAQAAATRPSTLNADIKPAAKPRSASKFSFSLPFTKSRQLPPPITYTNGKPVTESPALTANDNKRKKLVLAGLVLLAAVSAFAFNMLAKPVAMKQTSAVETPKVSAPPAKQALQRQPRAVMPDVEVPKTKTHLGLANAPATDSLLTGSLPARKTDATMTSIVAVPGAARAEMPPPEAGPQALREAAARGDAKAQFVIASRYLDGQATAQDLPKAAYWYQQAASRGLAPAQYRLATLFERGKGVPQDVATALLWYERAAESGNVKAMHNAAVIAAGNQAGTPNYDKAFKWFKGAAERGLHDSQFNLAVLFERGLGTRIDKAEALFWYTLAAKQGDGDAAKRAEAVVRTILPGSATAVAARVAKWSPKPTVDDGNVISVTDPVWNDAPAKSAAAPALLITGADPAGMLGAATAESPVAEAQTLLTKLGFNVGAADGRMGSRTASAVRLFQLQSGLKVTGDVTPEVLEAMRAKSS